jgi:hypothetical protein
VNTQSVEQYSEIIPPEFSINAEAGFRSNLSKGWDTTWLSCEISSTRRLLHPKPFDRSRIAAEHMYSNYRFKSVRLYRSSGVLQLVLALTLLIILIVSGTSGISTAYGGCNVHGGACTGRVSVCRDVPY